VSLDIFSEEIKFYQLSEDVFTRYREEEGYVKEDVKPMPTNEFQKKVRV